MSMIKGPAVFLAQFAGDEAPFNSLPSIAQWAADLGYKGIQIPSWDGRLFDLAKAAESDAYCDEVKGICKDAGVEVTELVRTSDAGWGDRDVSTRNRRLRRDVKQYNERLPLLKHPWPETRYQCKPLKLSQSER